MLRLRKKPLISENDRFKHGHLCRRPYLPPPLPPPISAAVAATVLKIERFATRDLASALANLILPSRPFFTLISGWNNSWVINSAAAKNWFTASAVPLIVDPLYWLDLAPTDFLRWRSSWLNLSLAQESLKKTWVGVSRTITAETFTAAFLHWFEWREKCVFIGGDHVEKS